MDKRVISFFILTFVFVIIGVPASAQQPEAIPPRVVETLPFQGEELLLDQAVTLYFDQAMNRAAVESALQSSAPTLLTWQDDLTLVIAPENAWERDQQLTFTLATDAANADGVTLADPIEISFQTIGFLQVSQVLPAPDAAEVGNDSLITVIFNRPVVPLLSLEEQAALPNPLTIEPTIEGQGEWLNTSIFVFRPEPSLPGGLEFTATINAGLQDVTGALLQEDFAWSFSTLPPQIVDVFPYGDGSYIPLDANVRVNFSQAMNPEQTQTAFELRSARSGLVAGGFAWENDNRRLIFTPDEPLAMDTEYFINIYADKTASSSGAKLGDSWASSFGTVLYPEIIDTYPTDGDTRAAPYGGFDIFFSAPIDPDTLEDKIIIEPEPWRAYETYYYSYNNRYSLFFDREPSTEYTITILPGIADPYGNTIDTEKVVRFTTVDYDPEINLNVPGFVGLYSAYNPNTRLFATHRNVSRLSMKLYELDIKTVAGFLGNNSYEFMEEWVPTEQSLLRRWSMNVQSQPNMRRYELLMLSREGEDGISNIQCLNAPAPRMAVGDLGMVSTDDPRPLRVRDLPNLQGEILDEIEPGMTFEVIGGPLCADGYIWWHIQVGGDLIGWSAEGTNANYFIETLERRGPIIEGDLDPADYPALAPGFYYLNLTAPETDALGYSPLEHVAVVATANITLKFSPNQALAWVTDLASGQPLADVPVQFFDADFNLLGRLNTNQEGVATLEIPHLDSLYTTIYALASTNEQFGFASSSLDWGISPWEFGVWGDYEPSNFEVYLYSDRPLYRPGQPVYFRGVARDRFDTRLSAPSAVSTLPIIVYDPQDQIVYEGNLPLTPHGTFSGEFTLDDEAALGYYRIVVQTEQGYGYYSLGFSVGEYVAPEYLVSATAAQDAVMQGETIEVLVESRYFFGGAVSNARVEWTALSANYFFSYSGEGYYQFTDFNYDEGPGEYYGSYGEEIANGMGTTDEQGRFIISLPADLGTKTQSQQYTIEARVFDESERWIASNTAVIVHQGDVYLGARPEQYISRAEQEAAVQVIAVDWDSQPVANQEVEYKVVERVWSSVQEQDELGRTIWTWEVEEIALDDAEGTVTTDASGKAAFTFVPPNAGTYKAYVSTRDSQGNQIKSATFMWVSGSQYVSWRQQNSNRFDLITNADNYSVGDTAEILIASPFQGETVALITVERGDILHHEVLRMQTNSEVFRLPITDDHAPNVFVSVILVKGVDENNAYAQFRMGMTQLTVDTERLVMHIEVTPDVPAGEFVGPGDTVTYKIKTTDFAGEPVSAEVGIGVTDLAVLSIAPPNSGTLLEYFYAERGVSVRTSTPLTVSVDQATQTIIDTIKGGGGGGAESGIFDIRQEFVDTPGWEPSLVTDDNGEGEYTLTLPDNLTTWRLDARAVTDGLASPMLVGQATFDLISTKPLLVRPLTPRFLVVDDVIQFGAIVNNNTGESQNVEIALQGTGFETLPGVELSQTVEIPAGGRQRVNWDVRILDVTAVDLTFFANGNNGQYTDASKPPSGLGDDRILPVYKYEVPETVGTAGLLTEGGSRSELIVLPRRFEVTQGELSIQLDRSLAGAAVDGLDYLQNYPHQCTEQTVSKFLPNVVTLRAFAQLGLDDPELQQNLDAQVNFALQRLYANQKVDGGWGWFPQNSSSPIVTAYALIGLIEARESGYRIAPGVIQAASDYLMNSINGFNIQSAYWLKNRQAFLLYAASMAGAPVNSQISVLYDLREGLNVDARAFLTLALDPSDPRAAALVADLVSEAALSATGAHWDDNRDPYNWTTNTRSTALALRALLHVSPENQLISQVVRWLMVARNVDAWETTQETAWAVMALTDWMVVSNELQADYTFSVGLNGREQTLADNTATPDNVTQREVLRVEVADLLKEEANRLTFARTAGEGNLYYTAHLEAFLPVPEIEPVSKGIIIDRKYYVPGDESRTPITEGVVADNVEVVLTIIAPHDLHYVVVEDPIPSGAAAVDTSLLNESILADGPELSRPLARGWGWWWFSRTEFRDEKVVMYADYLPAGTYEFRYTLRLGLPGTFNVIPATGQEFYFPEVYGRGEGSTFVIKPLAE